MATFLLDANVLIALSLPTHPLHQAAFNWFGSLGSNDRWATCPFTQCAYLRILSNPRATANPQSIAYLIQMLGVMVTDSRHVFWEDSVSLCAPQFGLHNLLKGHQQVTDGYLLCLAIARGGTLATFDKAIPILAKGVGSVQAVLLLQP